MTRGTKEWARNKENSIEGCENDCFYCYAKKMAVRFGRRTPENWHEMRPNARLGKPVHKLDGIVMFPTAHDLHFRHREWWMPFLISLLKCGNTVLIVSKPEFKAIKLICDECPPYKKQIEFRFTIGTTREISRMFWEPGAPTISERVLALSYAYNQGYETSVSMEPLLMKNPRRLIDIVDPFVTGTIWIGTMNHMFSSDFPRETDVPFYTKMLAINSRENMLKVYEENKSNPKIRWKDSVQDLLGISQTGERR